MSLQDAKFDSAISEMQEMLESELQQVSVPPVLHVKEQKTLQKKRFFLGGGGKKKKNEKKERKCWEEKERKGWKVCCECSKFHAWR
jgi:hypothetical protein